MNRRGFLAGIFAAGVAPAFVKAGSLMRLDTSLVLPSAEFTFVEAELPGFINNNFLTAEMIVREALQILSRETGILTRAIGEAESRARGGKLADTITIRRPAAFKVLKS